MTPARRLQSWGRFGLAIWKIVISSVSFIIINTTNNKNATMDNQQVKIAMVGMAGSGKAVLISTLAIKMSQMTGQGIFLAPAGENRRQTLRYVQQNWQTLNSGQWPPSTPAGELIHLEWELNTNQNQATVRFVDCAGQDIRALFGNDSFDVGRLAPDLREVYAYLAEANILLFLINMEDLDGRSPSEKLQNMLDMDQMIHVLSKQTGIPRKVGLIFSQFDRYRDEVNLKYGGDLLKYMCDKCPQLHGLYIFKRSFELFAVAEVNKTSLNLDQGEVKQVPVPGFDSYNLDRLIQWIGSSVDELTPRLPKVQPPPIYAPRAPEVTQPKQKTSISQLANAPISPISPKTADTIVAGLFGMIIGGWIGHVIGGNFTPEEKGFVSFYSIVGAVLGALIGGDNTVIHKLIVEALKGALEGALEGAYMGALCTTFGAIIIYIISLEGEPCASAEQCAPIAISCAIGGAIVGAFIGAVVGTVTGVLHSSKDGKDK